MSQVDGFAPDPNSTNYDVQVQDTNTLQNAQSLTTNVHDGYSADDTPQTTTYSQYTTPPPSEDSIYAKTPIYVNINTGGTRSVLSVRDEKEQFKNSVRELRKSVDTFWGGVATMFEEIVNQKKEIEKHSLVGKMKEDKADYLERKIVRGPDDPNFFRRTKRELGRLRKLFQVEGEGAENNFLDDIIFGAVNDFEDVVNGEEGKEKVNEGGSRKLYSSTGNPALDAQINAKLYQLVTGTTGSNGMTQAQYEEYVGQNAMETLTVIKTSMQSVVIPRIYNMFWGLAESGSDYEFGFSPPNTTGNSANCQPTNSNP